MSTKCYACDAHATGMSEHNGERKAACPRHADPKLPALDVCIYCDRKVSARGLSIDGYAAHKTCHAEANKDQK